MDQDLPYDAVYTVNVRIGPKDVHTFKLTPTDDVSEAYWQKLLPIQRRIHMQTWAREEVEGIISIDVFDHNGEKL